MTSLAVFDLSPDQNAPPGLQTGFSMVSLNYAAGKVFGNAAGKPNRH
jgi:hypothetical protein